MRALGVVLVLAACGPGLTHHQAEDAHDGAIDAPVLDAPDGAIDAHVDAAIDAHVDAAIDARPDAAIDAHVDAAIDAHVDAAIDAAVHDAAVDAAVRDAAIDAHVDAAIDAPVDEHHDAAIDAPPDAPPDAPTGACALASLDLTAATLSGCDEAGTTDGVRTLAHFGNPVNVLVTAGGTTFVADFDTNRLRVVDPTGTVTTLVANTAMHRPFGLALSLDGTALYVETDDDDFGNHSTITGTIWHVDIATGELEMIADELGRPRGLAMLPDGRIALSDEQHDIISLLDPLSGDIEGIAGAIDQPGHVNAGGASARFTTPYGIVVLPDGDLAVADEGNHMIRRVSLDGLVSDYAGTGVAGNDDGDVAIATFDQPRGLAIGPDGALYVSDVGSRLIRRIFNGHVTTIAGSTAGYLDSDDPLAAQFYGLEGLAVSPDGKRLVLADGNQGDGSQHDHVRVVDLTQIPVFRDVVRSLTAGLARSLR